MRPVEGYTSSTYGDRFADVYDEWYHDVSDVGATVATLMTLAGAGPSGMQDAGRAAPPRILELGVGTGRIAVPLARAGSTVHGVDTSTAMLERLAANDPGQLVTVHRGDMVHDLPDGPFDLAFVAYNTIFNLVEPGAQAGCFEAVRKRVVPGGRFVVEAFIPDEPPRAGHDVSVRSLAADHVVLSISVHDPAAHTAAGQFVELSEAGGVRLRPWVVRYSTVEELDTMATAAGFEVEHRWPSFERAASDLTAGATSERHTPAGGPAVGPAGRPAEETSDTVADRHITVYRAVS